jgi:SAM-dependent methyltransferase
MNAERTYDERTRPQRRPPWSRRARRAAACAALLAGVACGPRAAETRGDGASRAVASAPAASGVALAAPSAAAPAVASAAPSPEPCVPPPGLARRRPVAGIMSAAGAAWLDRPERERIEPRRRILDALGVAPGQSIADVGAGTGYYALALAERVGPGGRVVATDVQPEMLQKLRARARAAGLANVETAPATEADAGLGRAAFDLALLVDVYHELARPFDTLAQVRCALREGGRLALLEYRAEDPAVPVRPEHKMRAEDVVAEIEPVGFRLRERLEFLPQHHIFVFDRAPPAAR